MKNISKIDFNAEEHRTDRSPISDQEIESLKSEKGGWSKKQMAKWGVPWPPPKGWRGALLKYGFPLFPDEKLSRKKGKKIGPKPWRAKYKRAREAFYKSWEWRTLRMKMLKEHGAVCACCGAHRGDLNIAGEPVRICVDHIKPLSTHWELRLDPGNLQILCDECNQGKGAWDSTDWRVNAAIEAQLKYQI